MKVKKLISIILCLCLVTGCLSIASFNVFADDTVYTSQDGLWKYRILDDGTAETYNSGECAYFGTASVVIIPDSIDGIVLTSLGDFTFLMNQNITSITIGDNINNIGQVVFGGCVLLEHISVSADNTSFSSTDGILFNSDGSSLICYPAGKPDTEYETDANVTRIETAGFAFAQNLERITLHDNIEYLGEEAFAMCVSLLSIEIPSGVETISNTCFYNCTSMVSVSLPDNLINIDDFAFYSCPNITDIYIPRSVKTIADYAFLDTGLTTIRGYYDTAAETFANNNDINFISLDVITPGDFNADESVTLSDYSDFISYLNGDITSLSKVQSLCADVDGDGAIDAFDLFYLDKMLHSQL